MPRAVFWCLRLDVELPPAIRRAGYLARARPAVSVRLRRSIEWGGHTHPPLHRASVQKPSIILRASRCVRSLRLLSVSGLLACSGSHLSAAPFAFVPRLLEPPSALQLPPPAVSISLPIFSTWLVRPLARAGLGPAFPSEIPRPSGRHLFHSCACLGQAHGSATLRAAARRLCLAFHFRVSASLHLNSNSRVLDCFSGIADLLDFPFLFQCSEIPCRCCVGNVQEFLNFVVGDSW